MCSASFWLDQVVSIWLPKIKTICSFLEFIKTTMESFFKNLSACQDSLVAVLTESLITHQVFLEGGFLKIVLFYFCAPWEYQNFLFAKSGFPYLPNT